MPIATPEQYDEMLERSKAGHYPIPSFNVTSMATLNAALEGAEKAGSDVIIQISTSGGSHLSGSVKDEALGAIALAEAAHVLAAGHKVMVALHTDHCVPYKDMAGYEAAQEEFVKNGTPIPDGFNTDDHAQAFLGPLLEASRKRVEEGKQPLFNGHMLDASAVSLDKNLEFAKKWQEECAKLGIVFEMEIGRVGGYEAGASNGAPNEERYTSPQDMLRVYEEIVRDRAAIEVSPGVTIKPKVMVAAAFGNVHGTDKADNAVLDPSVLARGQALIKSHYPGESGNPLDLVFHGGSGTTEQERQAAFGSGIVKFNIDTETQYAFSAKGVGQYLLDNEAALRNALANGSLDKSAKKALDPRKINEAGTKAMVEAVEATTQSMGSAGQSMYEEFASRAQASPSPRVVEAGAADKSPQRRVG